MINGIFSSHPYKQKYWIIAFAMVLSKTKAGLNSLASVSFTE
jgi:hypothetical protein